MRPSRVRRLRVRKAIGNLVLAASILVVAGAYLAIQKTVTLVVEGEPEAVRTMSANVGELLDTEGIVIGSDDLVMPSQTTPIADGMTVLVEMSFAGGATDPAPKSVGVWVMEGVQEPFAMLAARSTEDWFSAGAPVGQQAVVAAQVVVMGKDHDVLSNASTVGELLSAMGIEPDRNDRVLPSPSAPLKHGATIRYTSIDYRLRELRVPIPFTTYTEYTDDLDPGQVRLVRGGVA
ncbi:MAG: ubiquitin-like domain-containing protein, partial [Actinomycetota bacterium]